MSVLSTCMYVYHMYAWCLWSSESIGSAGTGVKDGCEPDVVAGKPVQVLCRHKYS